MATYPSLTNSQVPNFPPPLNRKESYDLTFPSDILNNDKRNFYSQIQFVDYSVFYQFNSLHSRAIPNGGIKLPIPLKLDDNLLLHWSAVSPASSALGMLNRAFNSTPIGGIASAALQLGLQATGIGAGIALNPLLFMQFQRPEFRQFSLGWVLTPRNEKESQTIKNIITKCKQAASPENAFPLMRYPQIAMIKMHPNDIFGHMVFKPCIIQSVSVSYNGGPTPAFFKNGAPAVITLTLNLQEMQFWFRDEIT